MKKYSAILALLFLSLASIPLSAQSKILGNWEGILIAGPQKIKLIIHISQDSTGLKGTLDSPDQGAFGLPMSQVDIKDDSLKIKDSKTGLTISALYQAGKDSLSSEFMQGGARFGMNWGRSLSIYQFNRPQTPKAPFPYRSEEVVFVNKNAGNIKLSGTLTIPDNVKNPPAVILISGSGPQDRNEKLMEHEPFFVLADHLSRNGIAVLRYDDRGVAKSEGDFGSATTYDFSTDAEAALEFLMARQDIDVNKIGFLGHSEGGMIAPMIASRNKNTAFIILLAGPGVSIDKLVLKQMEDLATVQNAPASDIQNMLKLNSTVFAAIRETDDNALAESRLTDLLMKQNFAGGNLDACKSYIKSKLSPWFSYFVRFNPDVYLQKVKCPVLALNGDLDLQVNAKMNLEGIEAALKAAGNKDYIVQTLKGLNHLFQEAKTGSDAEYIKIEQTMSPKALEAVSSWIHKRY